MELNRDIINMQGILRSLANKTGDFTKINYRGGNENTILSITVNLYQYLQTKNYILSDKSINYEHETQLKNIVLFFVINTQFKQQLNLEDLAHLMNIVPQLSKCILVNLIFGLNLCKIMADSIDILPLNQFVELYDEIMECLKKDEPKSRLPNTMVFMEAAAKKISNLVGDTVEYEDDLYKLTEVTNIILMNLTAIFNPDNWKKRDIFRLIGFTLLELLNLLLNCDPKIENLGKFIGNVTRTTCSVVKSVTIDVFCYWVEIKENDQPLQNIIAEKSYFVMQKYMEHKPSKELIGMIGTMARKPKSVPEQIRDASVEIIITNIEKNDANQKRWFKSLIANNHLQNGNVISCINKWAQLSDDEDVIKLLNLSMQMNSNEINSLVIKCASSLQPDKLLQVCARHFSANGFSYVLNRSIQAEISALFQKMSNSSKADQMDVTLLLLQNPQVLFEYLFTECLKNDIYCNVFSEIFTLFQYIGTINNLALEQLWSSLGKVTIDGKNSQHFTQLFNLLLELGYFKEKIFVDRILVQLYYREKNSYESLVHVLRVLNGVNLNIETTDNNKQFLEDLFELMRKCRCTFFDFNQIAKEIVNEVIQILHRIKVDEEILNEISPTEEPFSIYYHKALIHTNQNLFEILLGNQFDINDYYNCVTKFIQLTPLCCKNELFELCDEIVKKYTNFDKVVEMITDVNIMLSQLVLNQEKVDNSNITTLYASLKYNLENYGNIIKKFLLNYSGADQNVVIPFQIVQLLKFIPDVLKEEIGLSLVNIIPNSSIKLLVKDKKFVCKIANIKHKLICKTLAKKMVE